MLIGGNQGFGLDLGILETLAKCLDLDWAPKATIVVIRLLAAQGGAGSSGVGTQRAKDGGGEGWRPPDGEAAVCEGELWTTKPRDVLHPRVELPLSQCAEYGGGGGGNGGCSHNGPPSKQMAH